MPLSIRTAYSEDPPPTIKRGERHIAAVAGEPRMRAARELRLTGLTPHVACAL